MSIHGPPSWCRSVGPLGQTCAGLCSSCGKVLPPESDGASLMARMTCSAQVCIDDSVKVVIWSDWLGNSLGQLLLMQNM